MDGESQTSTRGHRTPTNGTQRGSRTAPRSSARAAGAGDQYADRDYWLWPLPPAGRLRVACQWLEQGIKCPEAEEPIAAPHIKHDITGPNICMPQDGVPVLEQDRQHPL
jgi:hypothetical protein